MYVIFLYTYGPEFDMVNFMLWSYVAAQRGESSKPPPVAAQGDCIRSTLKASYLAETSDQTS